MLVEKMFYASHVSFTASCNSLYYIAIDKLHQQLVQMSARAFVVKFVEFTTVQYTSCIQVKAWVIYYNGFLC